MKRGFPTGGEKEFADEQSKNKIFHDFPPEKPIFIAKTLNSNSRPKKTISCQPTAQS